MTTKTTNSLVETAYYAQHSSARRVAGVIWLLRSLLGQGRLAQIDAPVLEALKRRYRALLARDLDNVREGLYPRELLRMPLLTYAGRGPLYLAEMWRAGRRARRRDFKDLPPDLDQSLYPAYYRRNFHWQTDGYFSARSARVYDVSVEALFLGTADLMRRQLIPPVTRFLREGGGAAPRLLDVACGTGRALLQLASAHPRLRYCGLDISPYYIREAAALLSSVTDVSLIAANAEDIPLPDGYFDVVTCVFLFHELPRNVRAKVLNEMRRVLRDGGLCLILDSAQLAESAEIEGLLMKFAEDFHEPYYEDHLKDDLAVKAEEAGLRVEAVERHFLSKLVIARRSTQ